MEHRARFSSHQNGFVQIDNRKKWRLRQARKSRIRSAAASDSKCSSLGERLAPGVERVEKPRKCCPANRSWIGRRRKLRRPLLGKLGGGDGANNGTGGHGPSVFTTNPVHSTRWESLLVSDAHANPVRENSGGRLGQLGSKNRCSPTILDAKGSSRNYFRYANDALSRGWTVC